VVVVVVVVVMVVKKNNKKIKIIKKKKEKKKKTACVACVVLGWFPALTFVVRCLGSIPSSSSVWFCVCMYYFVLVGKG
jgi:hypothetical protein